MTPPLVVPRPVFWRYLSDPIFAAVPALAPFMRAAGLRDAKRFAYRRLLDPYTNFRDDPCEARAYFGSRFVGKLSGHVQRRIFAFGVYEPNLTAFIAARLRVGDVFVDVGANVGYFSLLASTLVGAAGGVVAIEASPATFAALDANVRRNGAVNVRAIRLAAWDRETTLSLRYVPDEEFSGGASVVRSVGPVEADVPAGPLATVLAGNELMRARLVKIDVEGAEAEVLAGLRPAFDRLPPDVEFVVETLPNTCEAVCTLLMRAGFHAYVLENPAGPLEIGAGPQRPTRMLPDFPARHRTAGTTSAYLVFSKIAASAL